MLCEFPSLAKGASCFRCGYTLKRDYVSFARVCKPPGAGRLASSISTRKQLGGYTEQILTCPHLLDPISETRVYGCGCCSEKKNGVPVTVFGCELHGRCVTFARGTHLADETVRRCATCEDNPHLLNQAQPPQEEQQAGANQD
jgi:hypothetical protein